MFPISLHLNASQVFSLDREENILMPLNSPIRVGFFPPDRPNTLLHLAVAGFRPGSNLNVPQISSPSQANTWTESVSSTSPQVGRNIQPAQPARQTPSERSGCTQELTSQRQVFGSLAQMNRILCGKKITARSKTQIEKKFSLVL